MPLIVDATKTRNKHLRDTRANQPAAADVIPGSLYYVTDEAGTVERSDGASWQSYSLTSLQIARLDQNNTFSKASGNNQTVRATSGAANLVVQTQDAGSQASFQIGSQDGEQIECVKANGSSLLSFGATDPYLEIFNAANNGIKVPWTLFPSTQVPSSDANCLDDYEEALSGGWTPALVGSVSSSGVTYTNQDGWYVKIGRLVQAGFLIILSSKGSISGAISMSGLPFTVANIVPAGTPQTVVWAITASYVNIYNVAVQNTTTALLRGNTAAASNNVGNLQDTDLASNSVLAGAVIYVASQ